MYVNYRREAWSPYENKYRLSSLKRTALAHIVTIYEEVEDAVTINQLILQLRFTLPTNGFDVFVDEGSFSGDNVNTNYLPIFQVPPDFQAVRIWEYEQEWEFLLFGIIVDR